MKKNKNPLPNKKNEPKYNTDVEDVKRQSKIPRLSRASVERVPQPKKYIPESEYVPNDAPKKTQMRRSQSFLQNKVQNKKPVVNNVHNYRKVANSAAKPSIDSKSGSRRSVNYKPYTLREYKDMSNKEVNFVEKKRGGLGANIGGDEWQKQQEKRQRMKEFASRVKKQSNNINDSMRRTSQTQNVENREK